LRVRVSLSRPTLTRRSSCLLPLHIQVILVPTRYWFRLMFLAFVLSI
jgi:hypothetical protein